MSCEVCRGQGYCPVCSDDDYDIEIEQDKEDEYYDMKHDSLRDEKFLNEEEE